MSNLRSIRDPRVSVEALEAAILVVGCEAGAHGLSRIHLEIMQAIDGFKPAAPSCEALTLRTGLNRMVMLEHLRVLREKGLVHRAYCKLSGLGEILLQQSIRPSDLPSPKEQVQLARGGGSQVCPPAPFNGSSPRGKKTEAPSPPPSPSASGRDWGEDCPLPSQKLNKTERFAEALSECLSVAEAGATVGWSASTARVMLCRLQKQLGAQAI